ncbi:unnamed protein product [Clonostachys rhizophaga]|uniref:Uncharacterized protein n=1 Tax=Clonostachys rhizophaga TaxID=160324 RepID=A0A9N9VZN1_9HYPO|nr:unnamed protein product [Clonostachys rhizophaga]
MDPPPPMSFSAQMRADAHKIIEQGHPEYLVREVSSISARMVEHFTAIPDSALETLEDYLHNLWYQTILAGKHISASSYMQDSLVCHLIAVKNLGPIPLPAGCTGGNVCSDGRTFLSDLPLFGQDLIKEFMSHFFQKGAYTPDQQENLAALLGRLASVGIYDGPALCILSLFRETLEVPQSLVADPESKEIPLVDLMCALTRLIEQSKFSLALLASGHASTATANLSDHSNLSSLGELAIKAGNIPSLGYSRQRLEFWLRRIKELSQSEDEDVQLHAESCEGELLQLLRDVGETYGLGSGY